MISRPKLRVGVLFGGRSGEHEVSLMSARSVMSAMNQNKYEIIQVGITHDGMWLVGDNVLEALSSGRSGGLHEAAIIPDPKRQDLYRFSKSNDELTLKKWARLDVVFPVLHGTFGEDGTLQGLLEMADFAYVGAGVLGSSLAMDKGVCKNVLRAYGIPVVDWMIATRQDIHSDISSVIEAAQKVSDFPLFVKPANLGSSVGVTKCDSRSDLLEGLMDAARYDRRVLIEKGVRNAREIEVSVLGNDDPRASIPGEIIPSRDFYSYEAKYIDENSQLIIPAPLPAQLLEKVQELAVRAFRAVDCAGMARVDFLLGETDPATGEIEVYLNELNTIPGFTKISMYPKLWEASGLPYPELIDRLIDLALRRKHDRDQTERRYTPGGVR